MEFKAGDRVYYPQQTLKVLTLIVDGGTLYPLLAVFDKRYASFTQEGHHRISDTHQSIFLATKKNHKQLCKLYGVEFDKPEVTND